MKKIKEIWNKFDKKQRRLLTMLLFVVVILVIFIVVIQIIVGSKKTYTQLEVLLKNSAEKYYQDNVELLPQNDGATVSLDSSVLVEKKYIKELKKYNKDAESCSAVINVTNNNGYYLYLPYLNCPDYKTESLYDHILKEQGTVASGDGLYQYEKEYIYRGEYPRNYVKFAGKLWRILRLTSDREIRLIQFDSFDPYSWDDRYNAKQTSNVGITDFEISRISDELGRIYKNNEIFKDVDRSYLVSKNLCIGSRDSKVIDNSGAVECKTLTKKKYPLGLLQVNEYMYGSLDLNCKYPSYTSCTNYNYFTNLKDPFWTITPFADNDYQPYYVSKRVLYGDASNYYNIRLVVNITNKAVYVAGDGSKANPYIFNAKEIKK